MLPHAPDAANRLTESRERVVAPSCRPDESAAKHQSGHDADIPGLGRNQQHCRYDLNRLPRCPVNLLPTAVKLIVPLIFLAASASCSRQSVPISRSQMVK